VNEALFASFLFFHIGSMTPLRVLALKDISPLFIVSTRTRAALLLLLFFFRFFVLIFEFFSCQKQDLFINGLMKLFVDLV